MWILFLPYQITSFCASREKQKNHVYQNPNGLMVVKSHCCQIRNNSAKIFVYVSKSFSKVDLIFLLFFWSQTVKLGIFSKLADIWNTESFSKQDTVRTGNNASSFETIML